MTLADDVFLGDAFIDVFVTCEVFDVFVTCDVFDVFVTCDATEVTRDDGDGDRDESGDERNLFEVVILLVGVVIVDVDVFIDDVTGCRRGGGEEDGGVGGLTFDDWVT
jgi:hypothetical protein